MSNMWAKLRNREIEGLRLERNTLKPTKTKMAKRSEDPATRSALLEKALQELSNEAKTLPQRKPGAAQRVADKIVAAEMLLNSKK